MHELIWRERKVREATGLSKSTRWRLMQKGEFPQKVQLGPRAVGWWAESIIEWCRNREVAKNGPVAKRKTPDPSETRLCQEAEGVKELSQGIDQNGDSRSSTVQ
jgi:prophage regulatory protein